MAAAVMKRDAGECPDLEMIAAYLDARLNSAERTQVAAHLANCDDCYFVFSETARTHVTKRAVEPFGRWRWWTEWVSRPMVLWPSIGGALAAAATVWLAVGTPELARWRSGEPREMRALVAAVGTDRTIEPRMTGGFAYGPLRSALRSEGSQPTSPDVRIAVAQIEKAVTADRTPRALQSLGVAYLITGDIARAVPMLEEAAGRQPADAQALSDLSAAYIVRGTRANQPQDFTKALTMADQAVKADPRLAEAWFNRAAALTHLGLGVEARRAWQDYVKVDARSGWDEEAQRHLRLQ